jgi:hypothetical protein
VDGSTAFKVTVATNVSQSSSVSASPRIMLSGLAALSLLIMPFVSRFRRTALGSLLLLLVISTGLILGCGGGGSGTPPSGGSAVTPSGTYTLNVKAASGTLTATQALSSPFSEDGQLRRKMRDTRNSAMAPLNQQFTSLRFGNREKIFTYASMAVETSALCGQGRSRI